MAEGERLSVSRPIRIAAEPQFFVADITASYDFFTQSSASKSPSVSARTPLMPGWRTTAHG
jgi:hypothetical protein